MKKKTFVQRISLYRQRGEPSMLIDARITKTGALAVSGQDGDKPSEEFLGNDEYGVVIASEQKDRLLLALLEKLYKGNPQTVAELKALLVKKKIPHDFHSWV